MKKIVFGIILFFAAVSSSFLYAGEIEPVGSPLRKLQRGFLNVMFSPLEISTEFAKEKTRETFPPSWVLGGCRGTFFMIGRVVTGAYEMLTFPLPLPSGYAPILDPEFPQQHLEQTPAADSKK